MFRIVKGVLVVIILVYFFIGLALLPYFQYQINPDAISYINIAFKYLRGDLLAAINACWSPLYSWLMTPFLLLGFNSLIAAKLLNLLLGGLLLVGISGLEKLFKLTKVVQLIVLISVVPNILFLALHTITPDLLLTTLFIFFLYFSFHTNYTKDPRMAVLTGGIGALIYLSKSYGLMMLVIFTAMNGYFYYISATNERKKILRSYLIGALVFLITSLFWISVLTYKYHYITVGTIGRISFQLVSPQSKGWPMYYQGLMTPGDSDSLSVWDDPSDLKMIPWGSLTAKENIIYLVRLVFQNLEQMVSAYKSFSYLVILIIAGSFLYLLQFRNKDEVRKFLSVSLIILVLYPLGYLFIFIDSRYLWNLYILFVVVGGILLQFLFRVKNIRPLVKLFLGVFFVVLLIYHPIINLLKSANDGRDDYRLALDLRNIYRINNCNLASNTHWEQTLAYAYYLNCKYFGLVRSGETPQEFAKEIKDNKINIFFSWNIKRNDLRLRAWAKTGSGEVLYVYEVL